jgi:hypothetical protein
MCVALSADHFDCTPGAVIWADVRTLGSYLKHLRQVSDAAFSRRRTRRVINAVSQRPVRVPAGGARAGSGARWSGTASRSSHHD